MLTAVLNLVSNMFNKLQGQPNSYDKKFVIYTPGLGHKFNFDADPNTNLGGH